MPNQPSLPEIFTFQKSPTNFQDIFFDSHAHIQYDEFPDKQKLVDQSKEINLRGIVCVGIDHTSSRQSLDLHQKFPNYVYPTIGNHPYNADQDFQEIYNEAHQNKDVIIGIGETGLDYFKNKLSKSIQQESFLNHANLAKELDLPLIIHLREIDDCWDDCWAILKKSGFPKAIFHCFTGNQKQAHQIWAQSYKTSFSLLVTYPRNQELKKIMDECPLENLLIETDSPYLPPVHLRGQANSPVHLQVFS